MSTGQVSIELMLISDKLAATASRIRRIAASGNLSERQKVAAAAQLGNIVSAACYGGSELPVLDLMCDIEQLLERLQEFDDSRTEN